MDKCILTFSDCALNWEEALPLGNGSFGAMVFGNATKEVLRLNEDTLWAGLPKTDDDYNVADKIATARALVESKKYNEAEDFIRENMLGHYTQAYMPMSDLYMDFDHSDEISNYTRELDLINATAQVSYSCEGANYTREYFCSKADDVLSIRIKTDVSNSINCKVKMDSLLKYELSCDTDTIKLIGEAPRHIDPCYHRTENPIIYDAVKGIEFACISKVYTDGVITFKNNNLCVKSASYLNVYVAAKTSFIDPFTMPNSSIKNPVLLCNDILAKINDKDYELIKQQHTAYFSENMNKVNLSFSTEKETSTLTTKQRITDMKNRADIDAVLAVQLFQFGRYLMLSASDENSQAMNLQGIWNADLYPAWSSNYTININTQMNYWPVDVANLSQCFEPLYTLIEQLSQSGTAAAKAFGCKGWTANHNTDLWKQSIPVANAPVYAFWPFGGPWLATTLYEHYSFTQDKDFLQKAYPIMKQSAVFCLDWGYVDSNGYFVTAPSTSPENKYNNGQQDCCITKASTMDMCIMWQIFQDCMNTIDELNLAQELSFKSELKAAQDILYPYNINNDGRLQEWWSDMPDAEPGHRHVSHLIGLYPFHRVNCDSDTELLKAHYNSLEKRIENGSGHTSWSCAWIMSLYARLKNKEKAKLMILKYFKNSLIINGFSSHPPFQIDGNFGYTAGICEMLIQSNNDYIEILPALPLELSTGSFSGLKARGGYQVGAKWSKGTVTQVTVLAKNNADKWFKINDKMIQVNCKKDTVVTLDIC